MIEYMRQDIISDNTRFQLTTLNIIQYNIIIILLLSIKYITLEL